MRRHLVFGTAILATALVIAVLAITLVTRKPLLSNSDAGGLTRFLARLDLNEKPKAFLDLTAMYGWNGRFEVLDPVFSTREWKLSVPVPACDAIETDSLHPLPPICDSTATSGPTISDPFEKQAELARILRGERKATDSFLLMSPFLDERGHSFAWWLFEKNIAPLDDARWVGEHLSLFKPDELATVFERFHFKRESFEIVSRLPKTVLRSLVEGVPALVSGNELFVRDHSKLGFSPLSYTVYDVASVRSLAGEYDIVVAGDDDVCLERVGNLCWTYSSQTAIARFERYAAWFLAFAVAVFTFLLFIYFRSVAEKAAERERQRLSLQVLSHEFRTPVASMLLLVDQLRTRLAHMKDDDQDAVIRLSSEVSKLQRIIEMTKSYLQSDAQSEKFNMMTLPSVNTWVEDFAAEFDSRIHVHPLAADRAIEADPFWLRFALANLVQNAFAHGREPVRVRIDERGDQVVISVEDEGVCEFTSLGEMTKPFQKSPSSGGMGLGLNITETIVREWGGSLQYRTSPTSFKISVGRR